MISSCVGPQTNAVQSPQGLNNQSRSRCCCWFCCFTSQVNSYGHCDTVSSPNHTFSWAGFNKRLTSNCAHTFACNWQQPFLNESAEGRRMTVEIISWSISTKVWDRAGIELATPGIAVRHASVARHVTDCATWPGSKKKAEVKIVKIASINCVGRQSNI